MMRDSSSSFSTPSPAGPASQLAPIFAPDLRGPAFEEDSSRRQGMIFGLMLVVLLGIAGALFALYGARGPVPVIAAEPGPYKILLEQQSAGATTVLQEAMPDQSQTDGPLDLRPAIGADSRGAPVGADPPAAPALPIAASSDGRETYLAQVAALRSEVAAREAWARLAAQDPALFADVSADVQRADLGPRGVYFRLRAGYFPQRDRASRFCDRVKTMGQDCIVVQE